MKTILESLRIYAGHPLPGDPPEIMPWDDAAAWAWLGAARHTLGLLLAGEAPGPRLFVATYGATDQTYRDQPATLVLDCAAGCDAMEFGSDSGSAAMLANLGKSFSPDDIRSASTLCRDTGVDFAHYILFGGPGETEATVLESFHLMDEVNATAVIGMTGIRIFPGTALHTRALAEGIITPASNLLEPRFYISPHLGDRLCDLVTREALQRTNWVVPGLEINMSDAMLAALRHFPVKGPLWKLMKRLGRSRVKPM